MMQRMKDFIYLLRERPELILVPLLFVVVISLWEVTVGVTRTGLFLVPPPSEILRALIRGFEGGIIVQNFLITFVEAISGFLIGAIIGIILGGIIAESSLVEKTLSPYIVAFQTMPKIAIAPLIIIWFGYGIYSKIVLSVMVGFFPVLVNTIAGLKSADQRLIDMMRGLTASRWQIFKTVKFPNALPFIFAGFDVGIIFSVLGAIVGEFVGSQKGLGNALLQMNFNMDMPGVFSILIILSFMGISLHLVMRFIQRKVIFWKEIETPVGA